MARNKRNGGSSAYAKPVTIGNGTLSYEMDATSTAKDVTVGDVLSGVGLLPAVVKTSSGNIVQATPAAGATSIAFSSIPSGLLVAGDTYYLLPASAYAAAVDALKIASVTTGPNAGTRLPVEVNFYDGQLFRCDNAMKPTKVRPSSKSPAGLWHNAADHTFKLFTLRGSNTANPVRISIAVRQF